MANSEDPGETARDGQSHLDLHYLQRYFLSTEMKLFKHFIRTRGTFQLLLKADKESD